MVHYEIYCATVCSGIDLLVLPTKVMNVITAERISKAATENHMTFVIDVDNNITAYTAATAPSGTELKLSEESFGAEKEFASLAGAWPAARLIEIWNSLPGVTPVKKFTKVDPIVKTIFGRQ
ncbi:MAG: hypothetical protein ABIQ44_08815 [Chloroflexia bacterium]